MADSTRVHDTSHLPVVAPKAKQGAGTAHSFATIQRQLESSWDESVEMPRYSPVMANRAAANLLGTAPSPASGMGATGGAETATVQRACAECEAEQQADEETSEIQTKLAIGQPGDKYEQEADRVAQQVVNTLHAPQSQTASSTSPSVVQHQSLPGQPAIPDITLMRQGTGTAAEASEDVEERIQRSRGQGQPLGESVRAPMEQAFGADFSGVRVHTDGESHELNQVVQAKAFTTGQDIYFRSGAYEPGSRGGQELLAHELTHIVQQTGSNNLNRTLVEAHTSFIQCVPGDSAAGSDPATYAPQETDSQSVVDLVSSECGDLSSEAIGQIGTFLGTAHQEISTWESWRNQEGWEDKSISSSIPPMQNLLTAFESFRDTALNCKEEGTIAPEHTLVRQTLTQGTDSVPGLRTGELDLANEWMRYERNLQNPMQEYFCLSPESEVEHHYTVLFKLGTGRGETIAGIGAGVGGAVETPIGQVALGCFVKLGVSAAAVEFAYQNNMGMTWQQSYLQGEVNLQGECAAQISIGPPVGVSTSLGGDDVCSGSAYPDPHSDWYGPQDFTGATITNEIAVSGGLLLNPSVGASHLWIEAPRKPGIGFNTSGACINFAAAGGASASGKILGAGGQMDLEESELSRESVNSVEAEQSRAGYGLCEDNPLETIEEVLITRHFYFDTGESDPQQGSRAVENNVAARDILGSLTEALENDHVTNVTLRIDGHASPIWSSARTPEASGEENEVLAIARAENTSVFITSALDQFGRELPPVTVVPTGECNVDSTSGGTSTTQESFGSREGLAETGDPRNNFQRYRRATVRVKINRSIDPLLH